jgi:hypothetical protein
MTFYILDSQRHPVAVDVYEWARWFEDLSNRRVAETCIGPVRISTVFLGMDYRFGGRGPPLLFETMVFGGKEDRDTWRYSSWDDAETGHNAIVDRVRKASEVLR